MKKYSASSEIVVSALGITVGVSLYQMGAPVISNKFLRAGAIVLAASGAHQAKLVNKQAFSAVAGAAIGMLIVDLIAGR